MRANFLIFLSLLLGVNTTFAYELVLPKEKKMLVNTNYAFFVGKANKSEEIYLNDEKVYITPNGAFSHSIKLKDGENRVVMKSNFSTQVYKFYKETPKTVAQPVLEEFLPKIYLVKNDNTPLRSTPVDFGMNRMSHLFAGTYLVINGEKGNFYRVCLSKDKEAWIAKDSVEESQDLIEPKFVTMDSVTFKNASKHTIEFTENLPYTIEENEKEIIFKVYNPIVSENSVYTMNIQKPKKYTYKTYLNKGVYLFKVSELITPSSKTLEGKTIVIDAGHGGSEHGALGCLGDKEKDLNLRIASELKEFLELMGANVLMTRECDGNISLDERVKLAKANDADVFLSIHLNSIPDIKFDVHKHKGTSVYYYNENSKDLAKILEESISDKLGTRKDGIKTASFAVIRPTEYVGVLIETAYMTNPVDSLIYTKENFPTETAQAIADGLLQYITEE